LERPNKSEGLRRSQRTGPSVYKGKGGKKILSFQGKVVVQTTGEMKGLFWNCMGVRKKGLASYVRDLLKENGFDLICIQETMVQDFSDAMIRSVDPSKCYLWDWSPAKGKSGGILSGLKLDSFNVGSRTQGEYILMHVMWDKRLEKKNGVS
jgi:hypothetical protein